MSFASRFPSVHPRLDTTLRSSAESGQARLRQWIRSLVFQRVLRQERRKVLALVGYPTHRDGLLLHGLQQGTLGFGRGPVNLVGQHNR